MSTVHTIYSFQYKKKKITLNYSKSAAKGFFLRTQERVRNSHGKQAISVRATEVLLYFAILAFYITVHSAMKFWSKCVAYTACTPCQFSPLAEIPRSVELLENFSIAREFSGEKL